MKKDAPLKLWLITQRTNERTNERTSETNENQKDTYGVRTTERTNKRTT